MRDHTTDGGLVEKEGMRGSPRRLPTRIEGFDEIASGGLPLGGITVVFGGAGAGKTTFGVQVLASATSADGTPGVLVAFEESAERIIDHTEGFVWGGETLRKAGIEVLDARLNDSVECAGEFDLVGLLALVGARAKAIGARTVVFDGLDVLLAFLADPILVRREMFRLRDWVHASGLTVVVTAKADSAPAHGPHAENEFLQYVADCVLTLEHRVSQGTALRFVRISKYRGASHSANEFPFAITSAGIQVAVGTLREVAYAASTERVSTGVDRLDAMLSGGYYRGSSVLITGAPGTAKTSLVSCFAAAAAARGERTLLVSFDESPDQIMRNVASIGLELGAYVRAGVLRLQGLRARADSPEAHVARLRASVREFGPVNLVIDPLSALDQRGCEADAEGAALRLLDFAKNAGITLVSTSLLGNSLPATEQTPLNISTIADTWIHVSYVSRGGERNRALTIVKSRGTGHSNQVRELILGASGVTLADVYSAAGEVLMGTARWERENEERRARSSVEASTRIREQKAAMALAETEAQLATLGRARSIQQAELAQLHEDSLATEQHRAGEADELLRRRRADSITEKLQRDREEAGS